MNQVVPVDKSETDDDKHDDDDERIHENCVQHLRSTQKQRDRKARGCCLDLRVHLAQSLHQMAHEMESGNMHFMHKILHKMESPKFEFGVVVLVLIDCILVSFEALIDSLFTFPHGDHRLLASIEGGSCNIQQAQDIAATCRVISIVILFFFAIELLFKLVAAPKAFFHHKGHIFDAIVIFGSIVFEFTLHHSAGALMLFFRLWRCVRIVHAMYEESLFFHQALKTEEHLEKAVATINQFQQFTELMKLREHWKIYNSAGTRGFENMRIRVVVEADDDGAQKSGLGKSVDKNMLITSEPFPPGVPGTVLPLMEPSDTLETLKIS